MSNMTLKRPLYGPEDPRGPDVGLDVWVFQRAAKKVPGIKFDRKPTRIFDSVFESIIVQIQKNNGILASGAIGQRTADFLWQYTDPYGKLTYRNWNAPPPKPKPPPVLELVEPYQGWDSLHKSLYDEYSMAIHVGLKDGPGYASGTYNRASTLPSGAKSDHAYNPAYAFDVDIVQHTGWENPVARSFFYSMVGRIGIAYVILGTRIWSAARAGEGIRSYTYGGHENHVHTSGIHY
jgi:hypothetical protein